VPLALQTARRETTRAFENPLFTGVFEFFSGSDFYCQFCREALNLWYEFCTSSM
jgi:hypothetical protein